MNNSEKMIWNLAIEVAINLYIKKMPALIDYPYTIPLLGDELRKLKIDYVEETRSEENK